MSGLCLPTSPGQRQEIWGEHPENKQGILFSLSQESVSSFLLVGFFN